MKTCLFRQEMIGKLLRVKFLMLLLRTRLFGESEQMATFSSLLGFHPKNPMELDEKLYEQPRIWFKLPASGLWSGDLISITMCRFTKVILIAKTAGVMIKYFPFFLKLEAISRILIFNQSFSCLKELICSDLTYKRILSLLNSSC